MIYTSKTEAHACAAGNSEANSTYSNETHFPFASEMRIHLYVALCRRTHEDACIHTHTHWVTLCALATLGHETEQAVVPASLTDLATWWLSWDVPGGIWVRSGLCRAPRSMIS